MKIPVYCINCQRAFYVEQSHAGMQVACSHCGTPQLIPDPGTMMPHAAPAHMDAAGGPVWREKEPFLSTPRGKRTVSLLVLAIIITVIGGTAYYMMSGAGKSPEARDWEIIKETPDSDMKRKVALLEEFIKNYPGGEFSMAAKGKLKQLKTKPGYIAVYFRETADATFSARYLVVQLATGYRTVPTPGGSPQVQKPDEKSEVIFKTSTRSENKAAFNPVPPGEYYIFWIAKGVGAFFYSDATGMPKKIKMDPNGNIQLKIEFSPTSEDIGRVGGATVVIDAEAAWTLATAGDTYQGYEDFLDRFPDSIYAHDARAAMDLLASIYGEVTGKLVAANTPAPGVRMRFVEKIEEVQYILTDGGKEQDMGYLPDMLSLYHETETSDSGVFRVAAIEPGEYSMFWFDAEKRCWRYAYFGAKRMPLTVYIEEGKVNTPAGGNVEILEGDIVDVSCGFPGSANASIERGVDAIPGVEIRFLGAVSGGPESGYTAYLDRYLRTGKTDSNGEISFSYIPPGLYYMAYLDTETGGWRLIASRAHDGTAAEILLCSGDYITLSADLNDRSAGVPVTFSDNSAAYLDVTIGDILAGRISPGTKVAVHAVMDRRLFAPATRAPEASGVYFTLLKSPGELIAYDNTGLKKRMLAFMQDRSLMDDLMNASTRLGVFSEKDKLLSQYLRSFEMEGVFLSTRGTTSWPRPPRVPEELGIIPEGEASAQMWQTKLSTYFLAVTEDMLAPQRLPMKLILGTLKSPDPLAVGSEWSTADGVDKAWTTGGNFGNWMIVED